MVERRLRGLQRVFAKIAKLASADFVDLTEIGLSDCSRFVETLVLEQAVVIRDQVVR